MSEITKLAAALVKAQAAMTGAKKDSNNPFFKSKYADLSSVDAAIGPALEKHGLAYIQRSHNLDNAAGIETIIIHESGESLSCGIVSVPVAKHDAQAFGSAMTYARRYSLSAAFGVCPEDDDGNAATVAKPNTAQAVMQDSFDALAEAIQELMMAKCATVRDFLDNGNITAAYDRYAEFRDSLDDASHKAAFRSLFSASEKSALKKEGEARK